jgi:regulatory protein
VRLLAAREHSRAELQRKLAARFAAAELDAVLDDLTQRGLQSDQRFATAYARMRQDRGYGPLAIRHELQQRGVDTALIGLALDELEQELEGGWPGQLQQLHERKFGQGRPQDYKETARRGRYLAQRGFAADMIHRLLSQN